MKKLVFILISIFLCGSSVYAIDNNGIEILFYKDDIKGHQVDPEDMPQTRSIIFQPVHAFLYNKAVSVSFEEILNSVTISIVNEQNGETIYSQCHTNPAELSIDLSNEGPGEYRIDIVADNVSLQGIFSLD